VRSSGRQHGRDRLGAQHAALLDATLLVEQHFCRSEAGEDLHAQALGLLRQPLNDMAQLHHIATVVVEVARHQPVRHATAAGLGEEQHVVARDRLVQRRAELLPVGQKFGDRAQVHHRAGEDVRARLGAFLEHDHRRIGVELLHADRGGQACRPAADYVVVHRFPRAEFL
jgi:hypothetical protein